MMNFAKPSFGAALPRSRVLSPVELVLSQLRGAVVGLEHKCLTPSFSSTPHWA